MLIERVLGPAADRAIPPDQWQDPSLEPNWANKHPSEIDPNIPIETINEADRAARRIIEGMRKEREEFQPREETGPCEDCQDDYPCDYHATAEELSRSEDEIIMTARGMRNLQHLRRPTLLRRTRPPPPSPPTPHRRLLNPVEG